MDGEPFRTDRELFRSVRSRISEQIAQQLEAAIFACKLKPGDQLRVASRALARLASKRSTSSRSGG